MKLIIELDKVAYDLLTGKIETANIDLFSTLIKSVKNGTPLEEELEKIKEEIQGLIDFEESCCGNTTLGYECLGVINNKIGELKEEINE